MPHCSLADFLEELDRLGQLASIEVDIDAAAQPDAVAHALARVAGSAVLFRNVKGCDFPLAAGLFETEPRICHALGIGSLDELAERADQVFPPRTVRGGACQKVVRLGQDVDLAKLPVPRGGAQQTHRVITAGQIVSRDPDTGRSLAGHAELSIRSARELAVHWASHEPLARLAAVYRERREPMPLAVALGGPPECLLAAMAPLSSPVDRGELAGFLARRPMDVVRCRSVDLLVPAEAEFAIEGTIDPDAQPVETGPVATPLGHWAASRPAAVMWVTAMTHRANPVFPAIVYGPASREWISIHRAMQKAMLPLLRVAVPEVVDCHLLECGHGRELAWVAVRRGDAATARRVAETLWELPATLFCKLLVLVDEDVDVHDAESVWAAVAANVDPARDVWFSDGPTDPWAATVEPCRRMGLDGMRRD
jgi:4-hydroxy-3-polyprenylbenzoate decarboxylase